MKVFLACVLGLAVVSGCEYRKGTAEVEQERTEANQAGLLKAQPPVKIDWSLERENINKRTERWNDESKVSYIYLLSFGKVMAFMPIKGKVSSVNSQITNPMQLAVARKDTGTSIVTIEGVLPSPSEDGSYGTNGDAIFFFTTDGTYCEWNDAYFLCDKPLKLTTPPELVIDVSE